VNRSSTQSLYFSRSHPSPPPPSPPSPYFNFSFSILSPYSESRIPYRYQCHTEKPTKDRLISHSHYDQMKLHFNSPSNYMSIHKFSISISPFLHPLASIVYPLSVDSLLIRNPLPILFIPTLSFSLSLSLSLDKYGSLYHFPLFIDIMTYLLLYIRYKYKMQTHPHFMESLNIPL
jgi:hypothetical protein